MNGAKKVQGGKGRPGPRPGQDRRCRIIIRNLYRVLEEGTGDEVCGKIRTHLEACPDCAGQYEAIRRLAQICRKQPQATLPEETRQKIKKGLREALAVRTRGRTPCSGFGSG